MTTNHNINRCWFSRLIIAGCSAVVAMFVTLILVLFQDKRIWAILATGILVFVVVIILISINRYRWMANITLGGLVVGASWVGKGVSASAHLNKETSIGILLEATSWIEPVSLTICFIALLLMDLVANHIIPHIRSRKSLLRVGDRKEFIFHKLGNFRVTSDKKGKEIVFDGALDPKILKQIQNIIESSFFSNSEDYDSYPEKTSSTIKMPKSAQHFSHSISCDKSEILS